MSKADDLPELEPADAGHPQGAEQMTIFRWLVRAVAIIAALCISVAIACLIIGAFLLFGYALGSLT